MGDLTRPVVSIVLGTYNRLAFLQAAIASIRASRIEVPCEIIVVDGGSKDGTIQWLVGQRDIITIVQHNRETIGKTTKRKRSWGYFMNLGFKCAQGRYICLISDDSVVHPDTIANGVRRFDRELAQGRRLGGLAFYWRSWPVEDRYRVGITLSNKLFVNHGLFLRDAVEQAGWIDEERYGFYCADGDLSLKIWNSGLAIDACEDALLEHFEEADIGLRQGNLASLEADRQNYTTRWTGIYFDPSNPILGGWIYLDGVRTRNADHLFPSIVPTGGSAPRSKQKVPVLLKKCIARGMQKLIELVK
jgi:glycosyltransferase involved in cell wall biosynthesis